MTDKKTTGAGKSSRPLIGHQIYPLFCALRLSMAKVIRIPLSQCQSHASQLDPTAGTDQDIKFKAKLCLYFRIRSKHQPDTYLC